MSEKGCKENNLLNIARMVGLTSFDCSSATAYDIFSILIWAVAFLFLVYGIYEGINQCNKPQHSSAVNSNYASIDSTEKKRFISPSSAIIIFIIMAGAGFGGFISVACFIVVVIIYVLSNVIS